LFICSKIAKLFSFSICFTLSICDEDCTTGGTCGTGTTYPSRANKFTPGFKWGWCCSSVLCVVFSRLLLVVLSSFFWPLYCLSVFYSRILMNSLVSVCLLLTDIDELLYCLSVFYSRILMNSLVSVCLLLTDIDELVYCLSSTH
jgi:hypothetical protein